MGSYWVYYVDMGSHRKKKGIEILRDTEIRSNTYILISHPFHQFFERISHSLI